ncbi:uncharacterized protein [Nicotiana tomentosiformis]|uniref:uncharacterized protein n=1 Tax=Nicotiana tomentosiformis TaxID=4098 RepID=UPI00388C75EE
MKKNIEGVDVPKTRVDCTAEDLRKWENNAKAKKWLVKRSRGTLLYSQYESFAMKKGETIQEIYTRFTTLTNGLKSLGKIIPEEERVEKILTIVLAITWESKIPIIHESKNIATLPLDDLIGNHTAYELRR